jgi:hypothetical protein
MLINPHLASFMDLSVIGLGQCIHLPVQISKQRGGRKSQLFLRPGEQLLGGIVIAGTKVAFRYLIRDTGRAIPASGGDEYVEEFRSVAGEVLSRRRGRLEISDSRKGQSRLVFQNEVPPQQGEPPAIKVTVTVSELWSCFTETVIIDTK